MHRSTATERDPVPAASTPPPWGDIVSHRSYLVRFARRRLLDPMLAEDVVHDVFEAALTGRAVFANHSSLRTWLTGVLKHKIVDLVRERCRFETTLDTVDPQESQAMACPAAGPLELAEQRQRLRHSLARIDALPVGLRRAMHLYALQDQPVEAVCRALSITEANLHVRLHRARQRLAA
jgi:RNA polymerase sigma-70 factor, ECF subfamily